MRFHVSRQVLDGLVLLAQIAVAPAHDSALLRDRHIVVIPRRDVLELRQFLVQNVPALINILLEHAGLESTRSVAHSQLTLDIHAKHVQVT